MKAGTLFISAVFGVAASASPCMADYIYLSNGNGITEFTQGGTAETVSSTHGGNGGIAFARGDLYFASGGSPVYQFAQGGAVSVFASGSVAYLNGDLGMVADSSGNLYLGQDFSNSLTEISPAGTLSHFTGNLGNGPWDTVIGPAGNFYSAMDNSQIVEVTPSGTPSIFTNSLSRADFLAFDSEGDLFVSDINTQQIDEFASGSSTYSVFASGVSALGSLAFDSAGDLFAVSGGDILEFAPGSHSSTVFASGLANSSTTYLAISNDVDLVGAPEPGTWTMFAIGGLAVLIGKRKRKRSAE